MNNKRIIPTPFYTNLAEEVLSSVLSQLSDGWGESNPRNDRYWRFASVNHQPNGRVVIEVSTESDKCERRIGGRYHWTPNGFHDMDDKQVLEFFARMVKKTAVMELKDDNDPIGWKRDSGFELSYLGYDETVKLMDAYFIYDTLLGRDTARKYTAEQHQCVEGAPRSEEETAKIAEHEAKIAEIAAAYNAKAVELESAKKLEQKALDDKYIALRAEAYKAYQDAVKAA